MSELDEFFAKKDKRKSKAKAKYLAPDELYRNMEDTAKGETIQRLRKSETGPSIASGVNTSDVVLTKSLNEDTNDGDEWLSFIEEHSKDYSGLKIGQLIIQSNVDLADDGGDALDDFPSESSSITTATFTNTSSGGDGIGDVESKTRGPWKKIATATSTAIIAAENRSDGPDANAIVACTKVVKKVYVPPALRKSQADNRDTQIRKPKIREAPDLSSDLYFPSLGSATTKPQKLKKN